MWAPSLLSAPDGISLGFAEDAGVLSPGEPGSVTVTMPAVQGLVPGTATVTINGQPVEITWG
jgi:hypothetical protein